MLKELKKMNLEIIFATLRIIIIKIMKLRSLFLLLICIIFSFGACSSIPTNKTKLPKEAAVLIANDSLEYEIIIIDIDFY